MNSEDIRKKFIDFYVAKGHQEISAAPLLAENDPTLLFVNSGMFPLVPYLSGTPHPAGKRLVNCQRSFRTDDIEEVGDRRHTTFFEMLGNWSLGDYFKQEQLNWWYELLVEVLYLKPERIYQSIFSGNDLVKMDEESVEIMRMIFTKYGVAYGVGSATTGDGDKGPGVEIDFAKFRIFPYLDKNWWKRGEAVGELGGPDSETFYDTGLPHNRKFGEYCHINCPCGRFIEIGNSVFMQYKKTADGWEELAQKNVDFGGGLERLTMACNGLSNVFETDLFSQTIAHLETRVNKKYGDVPASFEIVADHTRAAIFLIADGGVPSNKDQGYFIRRLIRRGLLHLRKLGDDFEDFAQLSGLLIQKMSSAYPYLLGKKDLILENIVEEVARFSRTLDKGVKYFEKVVASDGVIAGEDVFQLFTTYGFPVELTKELAMEKGFSIDERGFQQKMCEHRELSCQGAEKKFKSGLADSSEQTVKLHTTTHLLHEALRRVLGKHVEQKGSNITSERLRFDFQHSQKMTAEEVRMVEQMINEQIKADLPVYCEEMTVEKAKAAGAIGLFESKYGERVRVFSIGASVKSEGQPFSREICSGPHLEHTGQSGSFKIIQETASSAGIRRIKAVIE